MKRLIIDLDGTITNGDNSNYTEVAPNKAVLKRIAQYKKDGFEIVISTARNMRTYENNVGKINIYTLPKIIEWLDKNLVPYDEILVGKPWCGFEGFYIDDKAIRPSEFVSMTHEEIMSLLEKENNNKDSGNEN